MKTRSRYRLPALLISLILWITAGTEARAEEKQMVLTGGDEDSGYTYLIPGVGSFETNCKDGGSAAFVYVDPDESVQILEVTRDGAGINETEGIFLEKGFYEVLIGNETDHGVFRFAVTEEGNSIIMSLSANNAEISIVREPDMELSGGNGKFRYTLDNGEWIEANVPQGAYTRETVELSCSPGLTNISGLYNGGFITGEEKIYRQEGDYIITFWDLGAAQEQSEAYRIDYCFRIMRDPSQNLSMINAPMGMGIAYAKRNGDAYPAASADKLYINRDGTYEIMFIDTSGKGLSYSMSFARDTAPPLIRFTPEFSKGEIISQTLYFSGNEDIAELQIRRDGVNVAANGGCIKVNGRYTLEIADRAGNSRQYEFTIKNGIPFPTRRVVIISAILIIAGGIVLIHARKNMQVL